MSKNHVVCRKVLLAACILFRRQHIRFPSPLVNRSERLALLSGHKEFGFWEGWKSLEPSFLPPPLSFCLLIPHCASARSLQVLYITRAASATFERRLPLPLNPFPDLLLPPPLLPLALPFSPLPFLPLSFAPIYLLRERRVVRSLL